MTSNYKDNDTFYIFNHVDIVIKYEPGEVNSSGRIVSATIEPRSCRVKEDRFATGASMCACTSVRDVPGRDIAEPLNITYTYSVTWQVDTKTRWSTRWESILDQSPSENAMWFSLANFSVFLVTMVILLCVIVWRTYRNRALNKVDSSVNWQAISGDVFRAPHRLMLFTALVGNGVQVFFAALVTLVLGIAGLLSPANRGTLGLVGLVFLFSMGGLAAYCSARLYKAFGGQRQLMNTVITMLLVPCLIYCVFLLLNLVSWSEGSSSALPVSSLVEVTALWLGISGCVTAAGAFIGYKRKPTDHPVEVSEVPRWVYRRKFWNRPLIVAIVGGVLPFSCIFSQTFFILNSIWSHQLYYKYDFLLLAFILLTLTCSASMMLLCYFRLSSEDYHWCWCLFLSAGFTGVYYCIHYYFTKLELQGAASAVIYFGYSLIMCFLLGLMTGSVGFYACYLMVTMFFRHQQSREKSALSKEKTTFENILEARKENENLLT